MIGEGRLARCWKYVLRNNELSITTTIRQQELSHVLSQWVCCIDLPPALGGMYRQSQIPVQTEASTRLSLNNFPIPFYGPNTSLRSEWSNLKLWSSFQKQMTIQTPVASFSLQCIQKKPSLASGIWSPADPGVGLEIIDLSSFSADMVGVSHKKPKLN